MLSIIISYFASRDLSSLKRLVNDLSMLNFEVIIVVNYDKFDVVLDSYFSQLSHKVIWNKNLGMNIGAWNRGFHANPSADFYLFLQDECFLKKDGFIGSLTSRFRRELDLGMLGESINRRWAQPWPTMANSNLNRLDIGHFVEGRPARRVDCYLNAMRNWGVNPGVTGEHLRSLVWAFPGNVLRKLGGFPLGRDKGECIAAEIAVSREIVNMGYRFDQVSPTPFTFFGHSEWRPDGSSKNY
jgi:hypothetical protein